MNISPEVRQLQELAVRLGRSAGPSRDLDAEIHSRWPLVRPNAVEQEGPPQYTGRSHDTVLALIDQEFPNHAFNITQVPKWGRRGEPGPVFTAYIFPDSISERAMQNALASGAGMRLARTASTALCSAFVGAKIVGLLAKEPGP